MPLLEGLRRLVAGALTATALGPAATTTTLPSSGVPPALYPARVDEKWGYIDRAGTVVIAPQWDDAEGFVDGLAAVGTRWVERQGGVSRGRSRQGWIDRDGRVVIPLRYEDAGDFSEGLARVRVDGRGFGYVDRDGVEVIAPQYEDAAPFSEGLAAVKRDGRTGLVDRSGAVIVPFAYGRAAWMLSMHEDRGVAWVGEPDHDLAGYVDRQGTMVIPPRFAWAQPFSEGVAVVRERLSDPVAFIDRAGTAVIRTAGDDGLSFSEGLAAVHTGAGWTYIDRTGATVIGPLPYRHVGIFTDGRAGVESGYAWGFIDRSGREVIPPTWTGISRFRDGLARMESGSLFGGLKLAYIDRDGAVVWRER